MTFSSSDQDDLIRKQWLKAASIARDNLEAKIDCPSCGKGNLEIWDVPFGDEDNPAGREIYLKCPVCNKEESLLVRN